MLKRILISFLIFQSVSIFSQEIKNNHDKIFKSFNDYYSMNIENIHLCLNKNIFLKNETIWFRGNVIEKKEKKINIQTSNVYVRLLDENFSEIESGLFYTEEGVFFGQINLSDQYQIGKYYLHAYTNYMNNFETDESTLIPIQIINNSQIITENSSNDLKDYSVDFAFEGGNFLFGTFNYVGIVVKNCFGKGTKIDEIEILDSSNNLIAKSSTNDQGYGKIVLPTDQKKYKVVVKKDGQLLEKELPSVVEEGINIRVVSNPNEKKTSFKFVTNKKTHENVKNNSFTILVQQNNKLKLSDFSFGEDLIKVLTVENDSLEDGINIIRLLDDKLNLVSERIFYNYKDKMSSVLINNGIISNDKIIYNGNAGNKLANLSISVLPQKTLINSREYSAFASLKLNNYLNKRNSNCDYYFKNFDQVNHNELDLFLMHETESKENINTILNSKLKNNYLFERGLSIEGKINGEFTKSEREKLKVSLFSSTGIVEFSDVNEKNNFEFKNLFAIKSSKFYVSILKNDQEVSTINFNTLFKNSNSKFQKQLIKESTKCPEFIFVNLNNGVTNTNLIKDNVIEEVIVESKKKEIFTNIKNIHNNNEMTKPHKITDEIASSYGDVLSYIRSNGGYDVKVNGNQAFITSRAAHSITGHKTPLVFINDVQLIDFSSLIDLDLKNIDEIYINARGYGLGIHGNNGSIRIYEKKGIQSIGKKNTNVSNQIVVDHGFANSLEFENTIISDYDFETFEKYGSIHWIPIVKTNSKGEFSFTTPYYNQEKLILNIQGIGIDGQIYDQTIEVDVK